MEDEKKTAYSQLILYRNFEHQKLFDDMCILFTAGEGQVRPDPYKCVNRLIELAVAYGFEGNLWHCFLAFCMASHENAYSTSCEIAGPVKGTLNELAEHDFKIFKKLFSWDLEQLPGDERDIFRLVKNYEGTSDVSRRFNKRIRERIIGLAAFLKRAEDAAQLKAAVTEFYGEFGVGKFGLNKAFRIAETKEEILIEPITNVEHTNLESLVGYELQKEKLIRNTEAFIEGKAANNVLLYGDSGTGKSSSIKGILNRYYDKGLRIIEVYKHQFKCLSAVLEQIKDRNYKFIIYMDDLSFEEYEVEYKYLKAIIEGGLGRKPENVLIYATSNRRHLIREGFSDKKALDDDLHSNDTVQEKLSLVARFGVTIYFGSPEKREFQQIVKALAKRYQISTPEEELFAQANMWELNHGGLSGRTAFQFITYLLGNRKQEESLDGN